MNKSDIKLRWSIEDGAFVAEVPELADGANHGQTYTEVVYNTEAAISEYIERAHLKGRIAPNH